MSTTKVNQPRKLTENEDLDSFEDFWFQCEVYYSRDEKFAPFFNDPHKAWRAMTVANRGLEDADQANNLNTLLRALATYALGPYVKKDILEKSRNLQDVKKTFMKLLEIDVTDGTLMNYYDIKRRLQRRLQRRFHVSCHEGQQQ